MNAKTPTRAQVPVDSALLETVRETLLLDGSAVTDERIAQAVRSSGHVLGAAGTLHAVRSIRAELTGLGPLQHLLPASGLTDVWINGAHDVWWEAGHGPVRVPSPFKDDDEVRALATRLIQAAGRRLDEAHPCVDVQTADGMRVHAVLPPISTGGTLISVRFRHRDVITVADLVASSTVTQEVLDHLMAATAGGANLLVTGSTGAGKTTVLNALLSACPVDERMVLIEDAAELRPLHPHVVGMQARHANVEGAGAIELAELVRQSLRMRPDRIVVGECRGAEIRELLTALNTGHLGAGTVHANSADAVPARLAALGALGGMSSEAIALQAGCALDLVVHLDRRGPQRVVHTVSLLEEVRGTLRMTTACTREATGYRQGPGWEHFLSLAQRGER
ncbi:TadA family conjugal transfer-associated ATPase [Kocuria sp.]|uniref:TadA family conjugal transfer-associated ATPase n=1 Tax=Kocuria sp. TaxID=1871328 RepID=UPI0026E0CE52|nr:TadA family conjugal transfer-associated ATPase [Kocuria sp.]MDO5618566.1 TadA family conjugal transfer-associated ATPase [Kocuria sp.]